MHIQKQFLRGIYLLTAVAIVLFSLEFLFEWIRLGRPGLAELTYADSSNNVKLVDVLSPTARAYNNMLAMLIAAVGLAIPLTANMHTPKLIEMFLRDRINQLMLIFGALGASHVLWVAYLIGPGFAPTWAYRLAIFGAVIGWIFIIPYFFYVIRFLDPSNILARLKADVNSAVEEALTRPQYIATAHDRVRDALHQIGTITIKSIDRADRGVAEEGVWSFKQLMEHYRLHKDKLPPVWFKVERRDLVGVSHEARDLISQQGIWLEHAALWQMYLAYQNALTKAPDTLSALSDALRVIAVQAAKDADERVLELCVRMFNNFFRDTIKKKDLHAIYDLLYQYRRLALEILDRPALLTRVGQLWRNYGNRALSSGLDFVPQLLAFDLGVVVARAFAAKSTAAPALLREMLAIPHRLPTGFLSMAVKAKAITGGRFLDAGLIEEAEKVRASLGDVPADVLSRMEEELLTLDEPIFWEVTDRQINLEYVPPDCREGLRHFFTLLRQESTREGPLD